MTKPKPTPRVRRSERSRRAVIDAAAKLLTERGYTAITMEGIAAEARVGKATVYRWWPNKASIFMELYAELAQRVTPPADTGSVVKDVTLLFRGAFKLYRETAAGLALAGIIAENPVECSGVEDRAQRLRSQPSAHHPADAGGRRTARGNRSRCRSRADHEVLAGASWYCILVGSGQLTDRHATKIVEIVLAGIVRSRSAKAKLPARAALARAV